MFHVEHRLAPNLTSKMFHMEHFLWKLRLDYPASASLLKAIM